MKRKITFLIAAIAAIMLITQPMKIVGQTRGNYTITFATGTNTNAATTNTECSSIVTSGSATYVTGNLTTATNAFPNGVSGLRIGKNGATGSISMGLSSSGSVTATTIVVNAKLFNSDKAATLSVNSATAQNVQSSFSDLTFNINSSITSITLSSSQYVWINSVTVNYSTGNSVTVTSPIANGSISAAPNSGVSANTNVTLTITPDDGYALSTLSVVDGSSNPITVTNKVFKMPNSAATVTGTFATKRQVTYSATNGTIVGVDCSGTAVAENGYVGQGGTLKVTATPTSGYIFTGWEVSSGTTIDDASANPAVVTLGLADATITALFSASYTVTYDANGGTGDDVVVNYAAGDNAEIEANGFTAPDCKQFINWNDDPDGNGNSYEPGDIINGIDDDYILYAQWETIEYTVTYNVNGNTTVIPEETVDCGEEIDLPDATLEPLTHLGWSETPGGTLVDNPYEPDEDVTLYAVFGSLNLLSTTITGSTSGFPTSYANDSVQLNSHYYKRNDVSNNSGKSYIQFKKSTGTFANSGNLGVVTSVVVTYDESTKYKGIALKAGTIDKTAGDAITPTDTQDANENDVLTFDLTGKTYKKFVIYNSLSNATIVKSIVIYYEAASPVTVNIINTDTDMDDDIPANTSVVVESGVTLTFTGENKGTAANLIIEDGGQLILDDDNKDVQATVKKSITTWTGSDASKDNDGWQTISTSTRDAEAGSTIAFSNVDNLVYLDNTTPRYNVYAYDEANILWVNNLASAPYGFSTLNVGQGYIYRTGGSADLEYKGYVNTGDINVDLSYNCGTTSFRGFNLIGNPYTHSIYKGGEGSAIDNGSLLEAKYYALNLTTGMFTLTNDGTEIPRGTAIMVQAKKEGTLTMVNSLVYVAPTAKAGNDNIWFSVKNENFQDFACVDFKPGRGLNKIDHYNENAPMLYINHNGENFGSVNMSDDTKSFNLNFKAMTMGKYTLSLKPEGNFSYIHVIDKLTGEDIDMLLEGEYSFIASPSDADNRFIVKLGYQPDYGNDGDIFAYQSGSEIYVTGNGELQIFDVTGRRVMTTTINGSESISIPNQGVYIFRLNEKVQKIVVR